MTKDATTGRKVTYLLLKMWVVRRAAALIVKAREDSHREFALPYSAVKGVRRCPGTTSDVGYHFFECIEWVVQKECLIVCAQAAVAATEGTET